MALTLINLRTRTAAGSAALSGFTQGVGYAVACLGPLLFGMLHDADRRLDSSRSPCCSSRVGVLLIAGCVAPASRACSKIPGMPPDRLLDSGRLSTRSA